MRNKHDSLALATGQLVMPFTNREMMEGLGVRQGSGDLILACK